MAVEKNELYVPTPEEFRHAFWNFVVTTGLVIGIRASHTEKPRFGELGDHLCEEFVARQREEIDMRSIQETTKAASVTALATIYEEMVFIACAFQHCTETEEKRLELSDSVTPKYYKNIQLDPVSEEAVDAIETVKDSIEKVLDHLPWWVKKILEALMEMLKLTRGGA